MAETKKTALGEKEVKKAAPKKAAAKKTVAKKETTSKATSKKSSTTSKATTKTPAKKAAPKKVTAAEKETVKKATPKKAVTTKKPVVAEKETVKKAAPKKATTTKKPDFNKTDVKLNFEAKGLPKEIFGLSEDKIYHQAIFDSIMSERASRRQGTHQVKSRAEVRGGGKKPWRQKGTGRARAGSTRSPIWVGGGRAFGPTNERNYNLKVNKKVKKAAFISALSLLAKDKAIILDEFELNEAKTKFANAKLAELKAKDLKHILIVTNDEKVFLATRNLTNVDCVKPASTLVEQLIWADVLILSKEGLEAFKERGAK